MIIIILFWFWQWINYKIYKKEKEINYIKPSLFESVNFWPWILNKKIK
jgi:hypothetical protein